MSRFPLNGGLPFKYPGCVGNSNSRSSNYISKSILWMLGGNCTTGQIAGLGSNVYDSLAGNSLEFWSGATMASFQPGLTIVSGENLTPYTAGHLEFNIMLGQPSAAYSGVSVSIVNIFSLNLAGLSNLTFSHLSVPLSTLEGTCGSCSLLANFNLVFGASVPINSPLLYVNNVVWTLN
jgi:hypothetical protein